jgi:membrane associated rhomboid family serine protease
MTETIEINQTTDTTFKKYIPILTCIICLISIVLFVGINLEGNLDNWEVYKKWGAPSSTDIFNGSYWGLISSNFLHTELWHIGFNLYWLWFFGKKIEFESSKGFYALLILSSAFVSSIAQLSFSDDTGIGLSGIGYSFFGFIYFKSKTTEVYKNYLDKKTINLFMFWLVLCIVLTQTKAWTVGNAAHIGGLLWGMTLAYISRFQMAIQVTISLIILTFLTSLIFWTPFSTSYLSHKAYNLHKDQKVDEAILVYKQILERDTKNEFAKDNLKQLEIHKLSEKAIKLHTDQKYKEARQVYNEILLIDKDYEWAKENLKRLPNE